MKNVKLGFEDLGTEAKGQFGFIICDKNGNIKSSEDPFNKVVKGGRARMLDCLIVGNANPDMFIGLSTTDYTVNDNDTMSILSGTVNEFVNYDEISRPEWNAQRTGTNDFATNNNSKAVITCNANANIYGLFISTDPTKGATSGTLFSYAKLASVKAVNAGDSIIITYRLEQTS